jgi:hypothetical protein
MKEPMGCLRGGIPAESGMSTCRNALKSGLQLHTIAFFKEKSSRAFIT